MKSMFTLTFLVIIVRLAQGQNYTETKIEKKENGGYVQYGFYKAPSGAEVKQGKYTEYAANGNKVFETTYLNGQCNGTQAWYWFGTGLKSSEGPCINGKLNGTWTSWHENGNKREICQFKNDLRNGRCRYWDKNGKFIDEVYYINGKPTAFAAWEKRQGRIAFLYPEIIVRLDRIEFASEYIGIRKTVELTNLETFIKSLPKKTWDGGRIVGIQGTHQRNETDYKKMFEIISEIRGRLLAKGYRILPMTCC